MKWSEIIVVIVNIVVTAVVFVTAENNFPKYKHPLNASHLCFKCPPGHYKVGDCLLTNEHINLPPWPDCEECPEGQYADSWNTDGECHECNKPDRSSTKCACSINTIEDENGFCVQSITKAKCNAEKEKQRQVTDDCHDELKEAKEKRCENEPLSESFTCPPCQTQTLASHAVTSSDPYSNTSISNSTTLVCPPAKEGIENPHFIAGITCLAFAVFLVILVAAISLRLMIKSKRKRRLNHTNGLLLSGNTENHDSAIELNPLNHANRPLPPDPVRTEDQVPSTGSEVLGLANRPSAPCPRDLTTGTRPTTEDQGPLAGSDALNNAYESIKTTIAAPTADRSPGLNGRNGTSNQDVTTGTTQNGETRFLQGQEKYHSSRLAQASPVIAEGMPAEESHQSKKASNSLTREEVGMTDERPDHDGKERREPQNQHAPVSNGKAHAKPYEASETRPKTVGSS